MVGEDRQNSEIWMTYRLWSMKIEVAMANHITQKRITEGPL